MYPLTKVDPPAWPTLTPAVDIRDFDDELVLIADLPGVPQGGVELSIDDNVLKIHGRVDWNIEKGAHIVYQEGPIGDYLRTFILSDEVDASAISAEFDDGVLTVRLPKQRRASASHVRN